MKKLLIENIKKFIFNYTPFGAPVYSYNLEPIQLSEIIVSIEKIKNIKGSICEIGVARGMTSRFICEHLKIQNYKETFYCIDTFASFEKEDIDFEIQNRKKDKKEIVGFSYNNFEEGFQGEDMEMYEFLFYILVASLLEIVDECNIEKTHL